MGRSKVEDAQATNSMLEEKIKSTLEVRGQAGVTVPVRSVVTVAAQSGSTGTQIDGGRSVEPVAAQSGSTGTPIDGGRSVVTATTQSFITGTQAASTEGNRTTTTEVDGERKLITRIPASATSSSNMYQTPMKIIR